MTVKYLNATRELVNAVAASYKEALAKAAEAVEKAEGNPNAEQKALIEAPANMHNDLVAAGALEGAAVTMFNAKITDEQIQMIAGLIKADEVKEVKEAPAKKSSKK